MVAIRTIRNARRSRYSVSPGAFKARLRFDAKTAVADSAGGVESDWQEQFTVRGELMALSGSEPIRAQRLEGHQPYNIRVRYSSQTKQIDPSWRVVELVDDQAGNIFAIKTVAFIDGFIAIMAIVGEPDA
jgi:SPP1 family predicted phage head-tail adaptor